MAREYGLERIILLGRIWLNGYIKFEAQPTEVTEVVPTVGSLHVYARDDSGTTKFFYRDDAGDEHAL